MRCLQFTHDEMREQRSEFRGKSRKLLITRVSGTDSKTDNAYGNNYLQAEAIIAKLRIAAARAHRRMINQQRFSEAT